MLKDKPRGFCFVRNLRGRDQLFWVNVFTDHRICTCVCVCVCEYAWAHTYLCCVYLCVYVWARERIGINTYDDTCIAKGLPSESGSPGRRGTMRGWLAKRDERTLDLFPFLLLSATKRLWRDNRRTSPRIIPVACFSHSAWAEPRSAFKIRIKTHQEEKLMFFCDLIYDKHFMYSIKLFNMRIRICGCSSIRVLFNQRYIYVYFWKDKSFCSLHLLV